MSSPSPSGPRHRAVRGASHWTKGAVLMASVRRSAQTRTSGGGPVARSAAFPALPVLTAVAALLGLLAVGGVLSAGPDTRPLGSGQALAPVLPPLVSAGPSAAAGWPSATSGARVAAPPTASGAAASRAARPAAPRRSGPVVTTTRPGAVAGAVVQLPAGGQAGVDGRPVAVSPPTPSAPVPTRSAAAPAPAGPPAVHRSAAPGPTAQSSTQPVPWGSVAPSRDTVPVRGSPAAGSSTGLVGDVASGVTDLLEVLLSLPQRLLHPPHHR